MVQDSRSSSAASIGERRHGSPGALAQEPGHQAWSACPSRPGAHLDKVCAATLPAGISIVDATFSHQAIQKSRDSRVALPRCPLVGHSRALFLLTGRPVANPPSEVQTASMGGMVTYCLITYIVDLFARRPGWNDAAPSKTSCYVAFLLSYLCLHGGSAA